MAYELYEKQFLGGYTRTISSVTLTEVLDLKLTYASFPKDQLGAIKGALSALKLEMPEPKLSKRHKNLRAIWISPDTVAIEGEVKSAKLKSCYLVDQSHNWVGLRATGPHIWTALEGICPLDLHENEFPIDGVYHFAFEEMKSILIKEDMDQVLLLSASSSARSFLHAVETSLYFVSS